MDEIDRLRTEEVIRCTQEFENDPEMVKGIGQAGAIHGSLYRVSHSERKRICIPNANADALKRVPTASTLTRQSFGEEVLDTREKSAYLCSKATSREGGNAWQ